MHAAADAGAAVANHVEAVELECRSGRVAGAALRDTLSGRSVRAARAHGRERGGTLGRRDRAGRGPPAPRPRRCCGLATWCCAARTDLPFAVGARSEGRFLFLVPWQGRAIVGTSYEASEAPASDPLAFLEEAARAFPWAGLAAGDLALVHEGLVPGARDASGLVTRGRVIDHERAGGVGGLLSVHGVKYTTARALAEQAVDRVAARLGRAAAACRTAATPLAKARFLAGTLERAHARRGARRDGRHALRRGAAAARPRQRRRAGAARRGNGRARDGAGARLGRGARARGAGGARGLLRPPRRRSAPC